MLAEAESVETELTAAQRERSDQEGQFRTAEAKVRSARAEIQQLEDAAAQAEAKASSARTALREARDSVSALDPPTIDDADVQSGWDQFTTWVAATTDSLRERVNRLSMTASDANAEALRLQEERKRAEELALAAGERSRHRRWRSRRPTNSCEQPSSARPSSKTFFQGHRMLKKRLPCATR